MQPGEFSSAARSQPPHGPESDAVPIHMQVTAADPQSATPQKYHIWTIGCQMNVADSNHVAAELEKIGYGPTDQLDDADVVVLNTCVVRQSAEDKAARQARQPQTVAHRPTPTAPWR